MGGETSKPVPRPLTPTKQLTDQPWRHLTFTEENEKKIKEDMASQFSSDRVKRANILLLGPIKAGKSSFLNSVASICKGRMANMSIAGESDASLTTELGKFAPREGMMKNFCLMDCMGLECEGHGFNVEDASYLVKGNVPRDYKVPTFGSQLLLDRKQLRTEVKRFNPVSPITPDDPRFVKNPKEKDKVHCVVYVVDAEALYGDIPNELKRRIVELQTKLNALGLTRVMILTKVDKLCDKVKDDVSNIYRSVKVEDIVKKASEIFRIPENLIYPVKNYASASETDTNWKVNIPILMAMTKILNFAEDYLEKMYPESSDED